MQPDAESLGTNSNGTIHQVCTCVMRVSGKRRDHRWKKKTVKVPHQRSPNALKFEDISQEQTERQKRCARSKVWNLARTYTSSKKKTRLHSIFPRRNGYSRLASTPESDEREFVVDSGASMHMVSKRDFNSAELEIMRTSRSPTTVMTANGEVQTRDEATSYVKQLDLFVQVMLLQ